MSVKNVTVHFYRLYYRCTHFSKRFLRPRFLAKVFSGYLFVGHIDAVRQCGYQREYPNRSDNLCCGPYGHPRLERINNDEKPVDRDRRQRQRGRVHAGTLSVWYDVTEYLAEHPVPCETGRKQLILDVLYNQDNNMRKPIDFRDRDIETSNYTILCSFNINIIINIEKGFLYSFVKYM